MSFITIDGTVDKAFNGGLGFAVVERWQVAGEERKRRWGVWFKDAPGLVEGQHVKVTGVFSSKIREYEVNGEMRRTVDQNVNNARIIDGNGQQQAQQPVSAPNTAPQPQWDTQAANGTQPGAQTGSWATAGQIGQASFGGGDDETPF